MAIDQTQFLGYLVLSIITLGSFVTLIFKLSKPINNLNLVIQELKICVNNLKDSNLQITDRLNPHSEKIDTLDKRLNQMETKMSLYHKE